MDTLIVRFRQPGELRGRVVDEHGRAVADAVISVAWTPKTTKSSGLGDVHFPRVAVTDEDGRFRFRVASRYPNGFRVVAVHANYMTGFVEYVGRSQEQVIVKLRRGTRIAGRVLDVDGSPIDGLRMKLMEHESRIIPDWQPYEVPAGAGAEIGVSIRRTVTDQQGRFSCVGFPDGRDIRVYFFQPSTRDLRFMSGEPVFEKLSKRCAVTRPGESVTLYVEGEDKLRLRLAGSVPGIPESLKKRLRVLLDFGNGGRSMVRIQWKGSGFSGVYSSVASRFRNRRFDVVLEKPVEGSPAERRRFGPYRIIASANITGLIWKD